MVMVGEDSGSLQADSRPKVVGFVRGSRPLNRMNSRNYDDSNIKLFIFFLIWVIIIIIIIITSLYAT